jgi:hypothetical protein
VTVSRDGGRVFVTGSSGHSIGTIAYDASTGAQLWGDRYSGPGATQSFGDAIEVSMDGTRLYVAGSSGDRTTLATTLAYDPNTGTRLWNAVFVAGGSSSVASALTLSPDGTRVYVAGSSAQSGTADYLTVAYDAISGTQLWSSLYDGPARLSDYATAIGVTPHGAEIFLTGYSSSKRSADFATVAYVAATGALIWIARYSSSGPYSLDYGAALGVSYDGTRVFVTGAADPTGVDDSMATISYAAGTGRQVWVARYRGPGLGSLSTALQVSPTLHRIYVTGPSNNGASDADYGTFAYDSDTGRPVWFAMYNNPANRVDWPEALTVSQDGASVFVTGYSVSPDLVYETVAYAG